MTRQFHRPARLDPEVAENIEGAADTAATSELAHRAAQSLVGGFALDEDPSAGRDASVEAITREGVVRAVAAQGVDDVAELWADSPSTTLPGTLWRLFLVREWIRRDPELVERRYATPVDLSQADDAAESRFEEALAGAQRAPSPQDVRARLDAVLAGECPGVTALAPVLSLTAGFLRALAAGSDPEWIESDEDELADRVTRRGSALVATADELEDAGRRAGAGLLD